MWRRDWLCTSLFYVTRPWENEGQFKKFPPFFERLRERKRTKQKPCSSFPFFQVLSLLYFTAHDNEMMLWSNRNDAVWSKAPIYWSKCELKCKVSFPSLRETWWFDAAAASTTYSTEGNERKAMQCDVMRGSSFISFFLSFHDVMSTLWWQWEKRSQHRIVSPLIRSEVST